MSIYTLIDGTSKDEEFGRCGLGHLSSNYTSMVTRTSTGLPFTVRFPMLV